MDPSGSWSVSACSSDGSWSSCLHERRFASKPWNPKTQLESKALFAARLYSSVLDAIPCRHRPDGLRFDLQIEWVQWAMIMEEGLQFRFNFAAQQQEAQLSPVTQVRLPSLLLAKFVFWRFLNMESCNEDITKSYMIVLLSFCWVWMFVDPTKKSRKQPMRARGRWTLFLTPCLDGLLAAAERWEETGCFCNHHQAMDSATSTTICRGFPCKGQSASKSALLPGRIQISFCNRKHGWESR